MFEIVMGIDDFLIQLVKYCTLENELLEAKVPNEIVKLIIALLMKLTKWGF